MEAKVKKRKPKKSTKSKALIKESRLKIKVVDSSIKENVNESTNYKVQTKSQMLNNNIKVSIKQNVSNVTPTNNLIKFKIGDNVKHIEEGILGTIKFVSNEKVAVLWEDGSRERFASLDLNQLAYVDYSEMQVSPLTNQMGGTETFIKPLESPSINDNVFMNTESPIIKNKPEKKSKIDDLFDSAISEMEDNYDDIEDANPNKLKEQSLKRQVATLEKKLEDSTINNIKDKVVNEIVSLMKDKKMIADDASEKLQRESIAKMDDVAFESYKNAILSIDEKSIKKDVELNEAEQMLQRIKFGGPIVGSFDDSKISSNDSSGSRDLHTIGNKNNNSNSQLNFDGFKNLTGITKPLQVVAEPKSPRQGIADAISQMDWTTISKMH